MTTTQTLTYRLADTILAASALLPHTAKGDITPVLEAVHATASQMTASDRYTAARYKISGHDENDGGDSTFVIPRDAVEWVSKIVTSKLRFNRSSRANPLDSYLARFTHSQRFANDVSVTVEIVRVEDEEEIVERSQEFGSVVGNFPPVERLIEEFTPAKDGTPFRFGPTHLEKVTRFVAKHFKNEPISFQFGHSEHGTPPALLTHGALEVLIQPNILIK